MKENAGYAIKMEEKFDCTNGIAFGQTPCKYNEEGYMYVTWMFSGEGDYFWGHYFTTKKKALKDYHERLAKEYERMCE